MSEIVSQSYCVSQNVTNVKKYAMIFSS